MLGGLYLLLTNNLEWQITTVVKSTSTLMDGSRPKSAKLKVRAEHHHGTGLSVIPLYTDRYPFVVLSEKSLYKISRAAELSIRTACPVSRCLVRAAHSNMSWSLMLWEKWTSEGTWDLILFLNGVLTKHTQRFMIDIEFSLLFFHINIWKLVAFFIILWNVEVCEVFEAFLAQLRTPLPTSFFYCHTLSLFGLNSLLLSSCLYLVQVDCFTRGSAMCETGLPALRSWWTLQVGESGGDVRQWGTEKGKETRGRWRCNWESYQFLQWKLWMGPSAFCHFSSHLSSLLSFVTFSIFVNLLQVIYCTLLIQF